MAILRAKIGQKNVRIFPPDPLRAGVWEVCNTWATQRPRPKCLGIWMHPHFKPKTITGGLIKRTYRSSPSKSVCTEKWVPFQDLSNYDAASGLALTGVWDCRPQPSSSRCATLTKRITRHVQKLRRWKTGDGVAGLNRSVEHMIPNKRMAWVPLGYERLRIWRNDLVTQVHPQGHSSNVLW